MTTRRNVLIGVGAIVAGGGAALGSGAFDQTTAERGLEVTVITDEDIAADVIDVHVDPTDHDGFSIDGDNGDDPSEYFPIDTPVEYAGVDDVTDDTAVSLIQNDVTLEFGPYLGASETTYTDFFRIINAGDGDEELPENYDVTLRVEGTGANAFEFDNEAEYSETINVESDADVDFSVEASETHTEGTLVIEIEEA